MGAALVFRSTVLLSFIFLSNLMLCAAEAPSAGLMCAKLNGPSALPFTYLQEEMLRFENLPPLDKS